MSLLIFSPRCAHSKDIIEFIDQYPQLKQIVVLHNVNVMGIPPQYQAKITRVPTMITKNGKILVGNEIKNWLQSLLPVEELTCCDLSGTCTMTTLDGGGFDDIFLLDNYGQSLQPAMTPDLEKKISKSVSESFNNIKT